MILRRFLSFLLPCTILIAQTAQYPQQYRAQQSYSPYQPPLPYPAQPYHLPIQLSECEGNECGVWTMNGLTGTARWPSGAIGQLTFERFGFDGVKIQRRDVSGHTPGIIATYTGTIDGNHMEGSVTWSWPGVWQSSPTNRWFAFITQPAPFALLDMSYPCSRALEVSPAEAATRGAQAVEAKQYDLAGCWLRSGASRGDANAKGMLSVFLYEGLDSPRNFEGAYRLAKEAVAENNYLADRCLSMLYSRGIVVPPDERAAKYWNDKANIDKAAFQAGDQHLQDRQRVQLAHLQQFNQGQQQAGFSISPGAALLMLLVGGAIVGAALSSGDSGSPSSSGADTEDTRRARQQAVYEQQKHQKDEILCQGGRGDHAGCRALDPFQILYPDPQ